MNIVRQHSPFVQFPAIGAVASSLFTSKDAPLPGFIGVGGTAQRIGPGFLGMTYAPFTVQNAGQPPANIKAPQGLGSGDHEIEERVRRRQRLFYNVEEEFSKNVLPHLGTAKEREAAGSAAQAHQTIY